MGGESGSSIRMTLLFLGERFTIANPIIMFAISYLYFAWFWIHGGQTLGMKTWRIRVISTEGNTIDWKIAAIRYFGAIISWGLFTLGYLWSLFDKNKLCWHDMLSKTEIVDLRK